MVELLAHLLWRKRAKVAASAPKTQQGGDITPQQEDEGLEEVDRMMEDTAIAYTFEMPANLTAEEIPATDQVPQLSEKAQHSERDQGIKLRRELRMII